MSLADLPTELRVKVFSYVDPRDLLSLSLCSTALHATVSQSSLRSFKDDSCELDDIVFEELDGQIFLVHLARGIDLRLTSEESREDVLRLRARLCKQLVCGRVRLKKIKFDSAMLSFIRQMLSRAIFHEMIIEMTNERQFDPCVVSFMNEHAERLELHVSSILLQDRRLQQLQPVQLLNVQVNSGLLIDDSFVLNVVKQGHGFLRMPRVCATTRVLHSMFMHKAGLAVEKLLDSSQDRKIMCSAFVASARALFRLLGFADPDEKRGYAQPANLKEFTVVNELTFDGEWTGGSAVWHGSTVLSTRRELSGRLIVIISGALERASHVVWPPDAAIFEFMI